MVREHLARRKSRPAAPQLKVTHKPPSPLKIEFGGPNPVVGQVTLEQALGTVSPAFADMILRHLINGACDGSNSKPISEPDLNGALAAMHGIAPRDEAEAMLAAQMVATHALAMMQFRRARGSETIPQLECNGTLLAKLLRTYTAQLEALQRYRGKGQQKMTVEHVHVHPGGQAIVGNVGAGGTGVHSETEKQAHAIAHAPEQAMPSALATKRETVPSASDA